ncbi:MAG: sigma-54 dependent transcriptional regulator [Thermodesulfobacteriota bacterium]
MKRKILIVDDEASIRESVAGVLSDEGFTPTAAEDAVRGLELLAREEFDLVLLDIWMPGMDGMEALKQIRETLPHLPVIMISGHGTIETAVQATRMGAYDFIEKPPSYEKLVLAINNALKLSRLEDENLILRQQSRRAQELTGTSPAMTALREQIKRVAPTDAWVLITGEHGTGKELVAQAIHRYSRVADRPMIELNCAAIPEELIESELFGHEKGAFTGATAAKRGKFDLADGGMLFLDEIADMSLKTQAKILRILQEQKFERVGGSRTISVSVRVLAATNKNMEEEISRGNFREDLFWRLNVVPIHVPPLRQRLSDLPLLLADFVEDSARKGMGRKEFTADALAALARHRWPGNVRELRNFVERMMIMCPEPVIDARLLCRHLPQSCTGGEAAPDDGTVMTAGAGDFKEARRLFETAYLKARLADNDWNISQTAEQIGLERSHLHKKIKALDIEIP